MSVKGERYKIMYRFLRWQLLEKHFSKNGMVKEWFNGRKLMLYPGRTAATGNFYLGLLEYSEMAFCLTYVAEEDFFIDCGANVGVYSVLLGPECRGGIALEPGSDTFSILEQNLKINGLKNVHAVKAGAGTRNEKLFFTKGNDTTNHTIGQSDSKDLPQDSYEVVDVITLDTYNSKDVTILKIDVEGMEAKVLEGANALLSSDKLNIVILETFGNEYLHEIMVNYGFNLCGYNPEKRKLIKYGSNLVVNNGIYVKNLTLAQKRLKEKKRYEVYGVSI